MKLQQKTSSSGLLHRAPLRAHMHAPLGALMGVLLFLAPTSPPASAAPETKISTIAGTELLSEKKISFDLKKATVVLFLSARCPCSNSHVEEIKGLAFDFPEFQFVGVHSNYDEPIFLSRDYFKSAALPFPILEDAEGVLAEKLGAFKSPHAFVLASDGQILYQGGVSSSHVFENAEQRYLRNALNDLKNNHPIRQRETRTLGCTIKRKGNSK